VRGEAGRAQGGITWIEEKSNAKASPSSGLIILADGCSYPKPETKTERGSRDLKGGRRGHYLVGGTWAARTRSF